MNFRSQAPSRLTSSLSALAIALSAAGISAISIAQTPAPAPTQPLPQATPAAPLPTPQPSTAPVLPPPGSVAPPLPFTSNTAPPLPLKPGSAPILPLPGNGAKAAVPSNITSKDSKETAKPASSTDTGKAKETFPTPLTELVIRDRAPGTGEGVVKGQAVMMHYTGWIYDPSKPDGKGKQFDSSVGKPLPFGFMLGAGRVIPGWDEGIVGMKKTGKRTLIIPAKMGYGANGAGPIPPNSNLIFDVELIDIVSPAPKAAAAPATAPAATPKQ
jgi:FKBP-type peptidyl-prolyl cis-trans isomerase FkpA